MFEMTQKTLGILYSIAFPATICLMGLGALKIISTTASFTISMLVVCSFILLVIRSESRKKVCEKCGKKNAAEYKFCTDCGQRF